MEVICPKCKKSLGKVESVARLLLTVHCPFDGHDFGVAVDPVEQKAVQTITSEDVGPLVL